MTASVRNSPVLGLAIARDLMAHSGACVVIPGRAPVPGCACPGACDECGSWQYRQDGHLHRPAGSAAPTRSNRLRELVNDMDAGKRRCAADPGRQSCLQRARRFRLRRRDSQKVKTSIHVGLHFNETSLKSTWHIPEPHFLEDWGDTRALDGTVTFIQPLIAPLYDSHVFAASGCSMPSCAIRGVPPMRSCGVLAEAELARRFREWWRKSVHDGLIANSALPPLTCGSRRRTWRSVPRLFRQQAWRLFFGPTCIMYDGRYANNIWLQELPHPMTKLTWDNAIFLSPATAKRLEFDNQRPRRTELSRTQRGGSRLDFARAAG